MTNYSIGGSSGTTGLSELTEPLASGDKIPLVNVSDTTTAPAGSAGSDQYMTASVLGQAIRGTVSAVFDFGADPTGGADSTTAIQTALFSFGTATGWLQGQGGIVDLGPGSFHVSNTLIVPSGVTLRGAGPMATVITMSSTVAADVIQWEQFDSAAQATILTATLGGSAPAQADLINTFFAGIEDLTVHGNSFHTVIASYNHGITCVTNPLTTAAGSDPGFDPSNHIDNVYVEACTGDGIYAAGRSGTVISNVWLLSNNGNGLTPSFDTLVTNANAGFNGITGVYNNHGATNGSSVKAYNNGCAAVWTTGQTWAPGETVISSGVMYFCILASSGSSTPPASDATHWTALTGATSPQAWGYDFAWDSGAGGQCWTGIDSQEPSAGSFWLNGCTGITIAGVASTPNFDNQSGSGQNGSNPNDYAAVYVNGANGCNVTVASADLGSVAYALAVTSATRSNLMITTDGSEQGILAPGSSLSGTAALVNGEVQSVLTATQSVTSGVQTLTFSSTLAPNAALGDHFAVTLTGNATMSAPTNPPSGSALSQKITFELIQDSTGGRTVTWNSAFNFGTTGAPTLSAATKRDLIGFVWSPSASKWQYAGTMPGL